MKKYFLIVTIISFYSIYFSVSAVRQHKTLLETYNSLNWLENELTEKGDFDIARIKNSQKKWMEEIEKYNDNAMRTNQTSRWIAGLITGKDTPLYVMKEESRSWAIYEWP